MKTYTPPGKRFDDFGKKRYKERIKRERWQSFRRWCRINSDVIWQTFFAVVVVCIAVFINHELIGFNK